MRLYINDILLDLPSNFKIARTKQVNDISSISNRQSNYTQRIKLPKTKKNIQALEYLSTVGSTTNIPYKKNKIQLFNSNGQCEIFDGYGVVFKSTDIAYELSIYDGYISFLKKIENKVLTDINITDLNHLKNVTNIIETWQGLTPYRYNLANYNGKNIYNTSTINIDYQIPSVSVKWLWDKIFDYSGFAYTGNTFITDKFNNEYFTFPKAISDDTQVTTPLFNLSWANTISYGSNISFNSGQGFTRLSSFTATLSGANVDNTDIKGIGLTDSLTTTFNQLLEVKTVGQYKLKLKGNYGLSEFYGQTDQVNEQPIQLFLIRGSDRTFQEIKSGHNHFEELDINFYHTFEVGDQFAIWGAAPATIGTDLFYGDIEIDIEKVEGNQVNFRCFNRF